MPWNHELFQEKTLLELMIEFQLDVFEKTPLEAHRNQDGQIQFKDTGDALIDKWEKQIAEGETPDFTEAFDDEAKAKLERLRKAGERRTVAIGGSFKDVYDSIKEEEQRHGMEPSKRISVPRFHRSNFGNGEG